MTKCLVLLNAPSQNRKQQSVFGVADCLEFSALLLLHRFHQAVALQQAANTPSIIHTETVTALNAFAAQCK